MQMAPSLIAVSKGPKMSAGRNCTAVFRKRKTPVHSSGPRCSHSKAFARSRSEVPYSKSLEESSRARSWDFMSFGTGISGICTAGGRLPRRITAPTQPKLSSDSRPRQWSRGGNETWPPARGTRRGRGTWRRPRLRLGGAQSGRHGAKVIRLAVAMVRALVAEVRENWAARHKQTAKQNALAPDAQQSDGSTGAEIAPVL